MTSSEGPGAGHNRLRELPAKILSRATLIGGPLHFSSDAVYMFRETLARHGINSWHDLSALGLDAGFAKALSAVRDGWVPSSLDTWVGLDWLFVASALTLNKYRAAGIGQLLATATMSVQAAHLGSPVSADIPGILGPLIGYGPQAILYSLEKEQTAWADRLKLSPSKAKRVLGQVAQFPVLTGGLLGVVGGVGLLMSDLSHVDPVMRAIFAAWTAGEVCVGVTDPRLNDLIAGRPLRAPEEQRSASDEPRPVAPDEAPDSNQIAKGGFGRGRRPKPPRGPTTGSP